MLLQDTWWETLEDPFVIETLLGCQPFQGVPFKAACYEINKAWIWHFTQLLHDVAESLFSVLRRENLVWVDGWCIFLKLVKHILTGSSRQHRLVWKSDDINHELYLFSFIRPGKQRKTSKKLNKNATKGPHVNLLGVRKEPQHNVGRSVKPALDISVDDLIFQTAGSEIRNDDA